MLVDKTQRYNNELAVEHIRAGQVITGTGSETEKYKEINIMRK